eukprot:5716321-Amphidinium_carterae.1
MRTKWRLCSLLVELWSKLSTTGFVPSCTAAGRWQMIALLATTIMIEVKEQNTGLTYVAKCISLAALNDHDQEFRCKRKSTDAN